MGYPPPPLPPVPGFPPPYGSPQYPPQPAPPGPRRYGIFRAMFLTPFSPDVWRDVALNWRGIGLTYMLILLLITWAAILAQGYSSFAHFVDVESKPIVEQVPQIRITDGVISIDKPEPYFITDPDSKRTLAIIDTTGQTTELPEGQIVLLTRSAVSMRQSSGDIRTHDLSKVKSFTMDRSTVYRWMGIARRWFLPVTLLACVLFSLVWRLILMLITAAIGLLFNSMFNANIPFPAMLRLSALAMTPTLILGTLITLVGIPSLGCFATLAAVVIVLAYLAFMVKSNSDLFPPAPPLWMQPGATPYPPAYR